jgi:fatty-acyl-CoA synthase
MAEWFEKKTFGSMPDEAARRWGNREALHFEGQRWSFVQFQEEVNRTAKALIRLGVQDGDKVSLWVTNRPEWLFYFYALAKIGAVTVPINTRFRTDDLEYVAWQSDSTTLITQDRSGPVDYLEMVRQLCPEIESGNPQDLRPRKCPELKRVIVLGESPYAGVHRWAEVVRQSDTVSDTELTQRQHQVDPDDTALIMYTSGTTGFPKGVMHCHNILRQVGDIASRLGITSRDVTLMYLPLFHVFGLVAGTLMLMVAGTRMVLTTLFDPAEALRLIEQERATLAHGFDTHFYALYSHPNCEHTDRSSLRTALLASGMASSEPIARQAQRLLCPTISLWGMTEVGGGAHFGFLEASEDDRCATSGFPLPGWEQKVINPDTGETVPFGTVGELCVRGYGVMQGYYKKPEETAKAIDAEGWLHSGDMATLREDGALRFLGRYKDLLKVGGENVDPAEVEKFLLGHPAIDQAQVVGVPDPLLSEVACACVVLTPDQQVNQQDLEAFCRGRLASFKIPRYTVIMDEFPMTSSGKVQKYLLREMAFAELGIALE